jgi:hypothetical protein
LFKKLTAGISLATRSCFTTFINGTSSPNLNTFNSQSVSSRFDRVLDYNSNKLLYKNPPFSNSRTYWGGGGNEGLSKLASLYGCGSDL